MKTPKLKGSLKRLRGFLDRKYKELQTTTIRQYKGQDVLIEVQLETRHREFVRFVTIPSFVELPDVVSYEGKSYKLETPQQIVAVYVEIFLYNVLPQEIKKLQEKCP